MSEAQDSELRPEERRPGRRRRVLLGGVVSSTDKTQSFECMIRDITDTGARLFARGHKFPSEFYLINVRDRIVHAARIVWTREPQVGVAFSNSFRISEIQDPALNHLAQMWLVHARARELVRSGLGH